MPDPATTKRVLARLAERPIDRLDGGILSDGDPDYRAVVDSATRAAERLEDAAEFVESGGLDRLDDAIETAVETGDHAAARRGREIRETFAQFRTVANGSNPTDRPGADHFHSGRGTPLGGGDEGGGK